MIGEELEFQWFPFSELLENIVDNRGKTCPTAENGVPLIATNCISNTNLYPEFEKIRYVSKVTYDTWFRDHPKPDDIIFVNKGTPGRVCMVPDPVNFCIAQDMVAVRANKKKVYPAYLFAVLRSKEIQNIIENMHVGTLIPHFKKTDFDRLMIPIPSEVWQRIIGDTYITFFKKIDLNQKMNKTLEVIARAIFKSWFIDFDPVHEKAEGLQPVGIDVETATLFPDTFVDSELGKIPKGWRVEALPEVIEVNPKAQLKKGTRAMYLEMKNMPTNYARATEVSVREFGSGTKFMNGDTLLARITPCLENGKSAFVDFLQEDEAGWGSTEYIVFRPRDPIPKPYAYLLARTEEFRTFAISNMSGTSGRQRVPVDCFKHYKITIPERKILKVFGDLSHTFLDSMKARDQESNTLSNIRDILLPKLLSGEIQIKDAEKFVENVI